MRRRDLNPALRTFAEAAPLRECGRLDADEPRDLRRVNPIFHAWFQFGDHDAIGFRRWRERCRKVGEKDRNRDRHRDSLESEVVVNDSKCMYLLERATGFEPATKSLGSSYSTN